ncbi:MAG: hypothetical protein FWC66_06415, partial [Oscillospiraceae bacterium]|nr:hypothetical protein [Oscillospiraceae bacterium]
MTQAQTKSLRQKLKPLRPYLSLPLILLVTILLWLNLPEEHFSSVYSNTGTWDLQGFNFDAATAALHGRVETIYSPFLTPQEFSERGDEPTLAYPRTGTGNATVRINIVLPTNDYYAITRISTGNADRIYVNGEWLRDIGVVSGDDLYSTTFTFATRPIAGVIEIVHQQSNFIYHIHGIYRTGTLEGYNHGIDIHRTELTTSIILGILIALAIISSLMFILLHSYRPALLFSLLCVAWFLCIGAMGSRAFFPLMPWHIDPLRVRLAIIISPVTSILMA